MGALGEEGRRGLWVRREEGEGKGLGKKEEGDRRGGSSKEECRNVSRCEN